MLDKKHSCNLQKIFLFRIGDSLRDLVESGFSRRIWLWSSWMKSFLGDHVGQILGGSMIVISLGDHWTYNCDVPRDTQLSQDSQEGIDCGLCRNGNRIS